MFIKYLGGRSHYEISLNRKPYYFTPDNNRTVDIKEKAVINYIFSLPNRAEFEVVEEEIKQPIIPKPKIEELMKKKLGRPKKGGN